MQGTTSSEVDDGNVAAQAAGRPPQSAMPINTVPTEDAARWLHDVELI
jgi:hypothetical protein